MSVEEASSFSKESNDVLQLSARFVFSALHALMKDQNIKKGDCIYFKMEQGQNKLTLGVNVPDDYFSGSGCQFYGKALFRARVKDEKTLPKDLLRALKKNQISAYHLPSEHIQLYFEVHCIRQNNYLLAEIDVSQNNLHDTFRCKFLDLSCRSL
tara:strand:+ start:12327 stop:12788 length:462 start_codon:yes stop_codon:yes gene_type:complete